ncbi:MAG TPA: symmetrical bis(5'-nucleosyl)-tetraphosphatase [Steroidobacteraceae bacterium]|nr:symmetrical bis(5'-nucleosyl)-tetraphosphatase [Steroidobacteraceae bacterium]
MATYAIGDVQGCFAELNDLLALLKFNRDRDQLWFVGDLVNRGPQSLEVLRFVRSLGASAITVLGNHDLHLLAVAYGRKERLRDDDTLKPILDAHDRDDLLEWLRQQPLLHHDAHLGYTLVHAGLPPQWTLRTAQSCAREVEQALRDDEAVHELIAHMYGNQPDQWSDRLRGNDRRRFIVNCFTRLRVCDAEGRLQLKYKGTLDKIPDGYFPWFRAPDRRAEKTTIVCGHWSAIGYYDDRDSERVLAIDTGCVWGERLCAVRLDKEAAPVFVSSHQPKRGGD